MPETVGQMLDDLHGIVEHLQRKYQVGKIIILGHSWVSLLGSLYVLKHPEAVVVKGLGRLMRDYLAGRSYIGVLQAEVVELVSINDSLCIHTIYALVGCSKA